MLTTVTSDILRDLLTKLKCPLWIDPIVGTNPIFLFLNLGLARVFFNVFKFLAIKVGTMYS